MAKLRTIDVDEQTADLLELRARERGVSVPQLVADLAQAEDAWPPELEKMREEGRGPSL
jgi:hypothetical protein